MAQKDNIIVTGTEMKVCFDPRNTTTKGIWVDEKPLDYFLPLFLLQLTLVVVITRVLVVIFKSFRLPKVISEIIGGVILGPSVMGHIPNFSEYVFPLRSIIVLETMANVGLLYFLFLIGVEMDLSVIKQSGRKSLIIALAGMICPLIIGAFASLLLNNNDNDAHGSFPLFLGVALSVTSFPVLARILAELKLLNTDLGKIAMSSAIINDMCAWVLLAFAIALSETHRSSWASVGVIISSIVFVLFCLFIVRPTISWVIGRTPEGENVSDLHICLILAGVMVCGFITDAIGTHSIFGAFVFGLVIPNGPFGTALIEKLEDFVSGMLLPLFFASSGLKTDVTTLKNSTTWMILFLIIILAFGAKVVGTLLVSAYYQIPFREGTALGMLMNTKGLIEMIVLNVGKDQSVLTNEHFTIMVIVAVITTSAITPAVTAIYKPAKRFMPYKRRTIQRSKPDAELRMLVCIHTPRNVPAIINFLEATHPSKRSPIHVYALHLVELTGRASAMLIVHNTRKSGRPALNSTQVQSDHIIGALENYEQHAGGVSIQALTVVSPYSTMHEDICNLAEDKRVAFIILPFHKQQTVDGSMEATNPAFCTVNQNVLTNSPCSVGILVDRGLGGSTRGSTSHISHHIVVLFFGGPDDREALAYASRMTDHPGNTITILHFVPGDEAMEITLRRNDERNDHGVLSVITNNEKEKKMDDEFLNEFRLKHVTNESVVYKEKVVNNGEETLGVIRSIDSIHDLYIVGRGQGMAPPLISGLTDWSDEGAELGPIGDLLASSDFAMTVSVLVVQQFIGVGYNGERMSAPDSPSSAQQSDHYANINNYNRHQSQPMPVHMPQKGPWDA